MLTLISYANIHGQVCTLLQTDNHASTHQLVFTGRMPFLPPNQQRQSTEGTLETSEQNKIKEERKD